MNRSRLPFAGRLDASGFLIDPEHIGIGEAHRRVAAAWVEGARLFEYRGRLILILPTTISVRAEKAPGLPLEIRNGIVELRIEGELIEVSVDELPPADLLTLVDLDDFRIAALRHVPGMRPDPPQILPDPQPPARQLRSRAGVGAADTALARRASQVAREIDARGTSRPSGPGIAGRLLARSPVAPVLRRRHARYLNQLTVSFRDKDWDEALRAAISLGGRGGAWTARLPGRRRGPLAPSATSPGGSTSVPYGPTVHQHLHHLYTTAANQLEKDGEPLLAAFVYADLLGNPNAAVNVLERHDRFAEAAELAEARQLDPALAVRLWWRAGYRQRAIRVASTRGAYAAAITRLEQDDRGAALELRREWMLDRRRAGDHLGAVTAAWPAPDLRDETLPDIAAGIALGGAPAGELLAHWLEHEPTPEAVDTGRSILNDHQSLDAARAAFLTGLSSHPVGQPAWDRELTSLALKAIMRSAAPVPAKAFHDIHARLQRRADPILVADLPRLRAPLLDRGRTPLLDATTRGNIRIHDAVAIGHNSVLVALGELGTRLITSDGRIRGRWDIPTHHLVIADHGGRALLITDRAPRYLVHQLDLPNARPVPLPALDVLPLDTYDGTRPVLVSDRGIEWVEPTESQWRLCWRELTEPGQKIYQVAREPKNLTALFTNPTINSWHWELPSLTLRQRGTFEHENLMVVVATGEVGRLHQESGVAVLDWHSPHGHRLTTATLHPDGRCSLLISGNAFAVTEHTDARTRVAVHPTREFSELASLDLPPDVPPIFRAWNNYLTIGHADGRLFVFGAAQSELLADITLRV